MARIRIDSVTIYKQHASVNGTLFAGEGMPPSGMNFNISVEDAFSRKYLSGQEYEFQLNPVGAEEEVELDVASVKAQEAQASPGLPAADLRGTAPVAQ